MTYGFMYTIEIKADIVSISNPLRLILILAFLSRSYVVLQQEKVHFLSDSCSLAIHIHKRDKF